MSNNVMIITEKDWEKTTPERRSWMMFNTIQNLDKRLRVVEKRYVVDKLFAFGGGIVGGALAFLGIKVT